MAGRQLLKVNSTSFTFSELRNTMVSKYLCFQIFEFTPDISQDIQNFRPYEALEMYKKPKRL